jgi:hypothetical protein
LIEMRIKRLANDTRIVTDEIVLAPLVPEVAGFILDADIAGQAPIPCKFGRRGFGLTPVFDESHGVRPANRDDADRARLSRFSRVHGRISSIV